MKIQSQVPHLSMETIENFIKAIVNLTKVEILLDTITGTETSRITENIYCLVKPFVHDEMLDSIVNATRIHTNAVEEIDKIIELVIKDNPKVFLHSNYKLDEITNTDR